MAKTHLGSLGVHRGLIDMDFEYFGETIRVHPNASDLRTFDMLTQIGDLDFEDPENADEIMNAIGEQLVMQIHPDDALLFWETSKKNNQQMRDLMAISKTITEAITGFPTGQDSGSTTGEPSTQPKSSDTGMSRRERRALARAQRADKATGAALSLLRGRPDLQLAVVNVANARNAEEPTG